VRPGSARRRGTRRRSTRRTPTRPPRRRTTRRRRRRPRLRRIRPAPPRRTRQRAMRARPRSPNAKPASNLERPASGAPRFSRRRRRSSTVPAPVRPCAAALPGDAPSVAYGGFQSVDLVWGDPEPPGRHLRVTDHRCHETGCGCGHRTRARPGAGPVDDPRLDPVALSAWASGRAGAGDPDRGAAAALSAVAPTDAGVFCPTGWG
jgi:hypothetical protein